MTDQGETSEPLASQVARRLQGVGDRPVGEHVAVYDDLHRLLQDALATLDEA